MRLVYIVATSLLLIGAAAGATAGVTAGQPADSVQSDGPEYGMEVTRTYHLTPEDPGQIQITLEYAAGLDARSIGVIVTDNVTVERRDGFERNDNGVLVAESDRRPELVLSVPANKTNSRFGGSDFVDAGEWAFVSAYSYSGYASEVTRQIEYEESDRVEVNNTVAGEGYAGSRYAYLGPYERETTLVNGQTFNVVVPDRAAVTEANRDPATALEPAAENYSVGSRPSQVNIFVAPSPIRKGGRASPVRLAGQQDLWVAESNPASRTLIHEYIHTRQDFTTTNETQWLTEASAEYYGTVYGLQADTTQYSTLADEFESSRHEDAVLSNASAWEGTSKEVDYHKGSRVLAALDHRIRTETDGDRTLMAVFDRLNDESDPVTLSTFKSIVADVAGTSLDDWIDRYVTTAASPNYPDDPNPAYYDIDDSSSGAETETATSESTASPTDPTPVRTETATSNAAGPGFSVLATLVAIAGLLVAIGHRR